MSDNNYQEVIKNNKLFDGIPPQNLKFELKSEQVLRKKEGEIIFQKGDESKNTYLLIAGRVKIKVYIENKSVKINKSINDFFGEIEVLEDTYRRSAAVANTDCILYTLSRSDLREFIEQFPEINDNIIAYNKVEIPELQISIHQGLLKDDTDKLYLTPPSQDKVTDKSYETSSVIDDETIYDNEGIPDETFEEESETEVSLHEEVIEENSYSLDENETIEPVEEASDVELSFNTEHMEEETELDADSLQETVVSDSAESIESQISRVDEFNETEETSAEEPNDAESFPDTDFSITDAAETEEDEFFDSGEESVEETYKSNDISEYEESVIEETSAEEPNNAESFPDTDISITDNDETEEDEFFDSGEESVEETYNSNDNSEDEESVEEVTRNIEEEIQEEIQVSQNASGSVSAESETGDEKESEWVDLNSQNEDIESQNLAAEEEKMRYEIEDQKMKYDDTEVNAGRILEAVKKINSSFDKHTVYSNIVNEAVKLTEAQAGSFYRVDLSTNMLLTEQETENGFIDVSYPISNGLTGLAAESGEMINIRDPLKDFRYSEDIDSIRGITGSSMLCIPVKSDDGNTIAVLCLANSSSGKFSVSDEEKISQLVPHIAQTLQFMTGIEKLLNENKDDYLSTLTKFITDNIQTPVLTMKYYAGQIKKKNVPQDVRTVLNVLMDQSDSVVDFLHSTLAFTEKRNTLHIESCRLREVMDDALGLLAEYVESRNVGLYKKVDSNIIVKLDKKAFYQACHQIAKNACDAMGESGNIYITAKQSGDLVDIEFRDTGPGIPVEIRDEIFQPFKSFNKDKGTGLGLTIARKIIRDHGGELTVESNPEEGATFIISLPVFDDI